MFLLSQETAKRRGPVPTSFKHDLQDDFNCDKCGHTVDCLEDLKMHKKRKRMEEEIHRPQDLYQSLC